MYAITIIVGFLTLAFGFGILKFERDIRHGLYANLFNASITIEAGNRNVPNKYINLSSSHYTIGRNKPRCDIYLGNEDPTISREHAELTYDGTDFVITPAKSIFKNKHKGEVFVARYTTTNPDDPCKVDTNYNKFKVGPEGHKLVNGDYIYIGNTTMRFDVKYNSEDE